MIEVNIGVLLILAGAIAIYIVAMETLTNKLERKCESLVERICILERELSKS